VWRGGKEARSSDLDAFASRIIAPGAPPRGSDDAKLLRAHNPDSSLNFSVYFIHYESSVSGSV